MNSVMNKAIWILNNGESTLFNPIEFEGFRNQAGRNSFVLTPKQWVEKTKAIGSDSFPPELSKAQAAVVYASEADVLNLALFGMTAKDWRESNIDKNGNIRDYADVSQLVCLLILENLNVHLIQQNIPQDERLVLLNQTAIHQMKILTHDPGVKRIEVKNNEGLIGTK